MRQRLSRLAFGLAFRTMAPDSGTGTGIVRANVSALIPEPIVTEIFQGLETQSAVLAQFIHVPVPVTQTRMPVLSALPYAYWRNGDVGLSQVSQLAWENKTIIVEDIDVIIPIPKTVLEDPSFDLWGQAKPKLIEALGRTIDGTVFLGVNVPSTQPQAIVPAATAAGNTRNRGTAAAGAGGIAEDLNQLMGQIEQDGFGPTGFIADTSFKARIRGARATDGQKLLDVSANTIEGLPVNYAAPGLWGNASGDPELIALDRNNFVVGIRRDITWEINTQGVITDGTGKIIYNLFQQGMVAMKVSIRLGWQVSNHATWQNQNAGTNAVHTLTQAGVTTGVWRISYTRNGITFKSNDLDADISAANLQAELEKMGAIQRGNITVTRAGNAGSRVYTLTYKNAEGSRPQDLPTTDVTDLDAGTITPASSTVGASATKYPAAILLKP